MVVAVVMLRSTEKYKSSFDAACMNPAEHKWCITGVFIAPPIVFNRWESASKYRTSKRRFI